jgi:hypothetical protein
VGNPETYLGPGGIGSKLLAGAASGAAGEGAGELTEGTPLEGPARLGASLLAGTATGAMTRGRGADYVPPPHIQQLFDQADQHYQNLHGYGVEIHPQVGFDLADNITDELNTAGYRPLIAPKTYSIVDELRNPEGNPPSFPTQQIESIRRALGKVGYDPNERDAARRAIAGIDDMMDNLQPANVVNNPQFAQQVGAEARLARANYAGAKRAEAIDTATDMAELQAASTGSGANIDNATRQKMRAILASPRKLRGFSDDEQNQMRQIVNGTFYGNGMRLLGKLAPTGIVSAGLSAGLGHALGHTIGVPVVGAVAKGFADAATRSAANRLSEMARLRTPLARQMGSSPLPPPVSGTGRMFPITQFGLPAMQNPYQGGP